ncbi:MAG: lysophospholipid acyltransferase family protein [Gammaproteobacteria bacterium]|jgi:KDO2-lipid IV(A) lauroyltransferase|nr:lysophospholipid acyltransferase family protein [Gammaproteobacteria bacterium]
MIIKLFLFFCSKLPLKINHLVGGFVGLLIYAINSKSKKVATRNIDICFPKMSKVEKRILVKKSLIETGKNLTESSLIWNQSFDQNKKYIRNIYGEQYMEQNNKTILLVPHIGCWEITGRVIALKRPVTFLYKPLRKEEQNQYLFERRNQGNLVMASADKSGVLKLQRALNENQLIGILPDQDPGEEGTEMAPFFNRQVSTMTLLVRLAKKHQAKVVMLWANRLEKGKGFDLNFEPVDLSLDSDDVLEQITLMNKSIEHLIERFPEQYMWTYKRFKSANSYD